ncbi:discoidin domain-containing protein [Microbacterium sp.]|uniref:discoidin domain-containing protein n=1 Tax=Microbacterium sp. TaxID=51671 RepID=UPI003F71D431
MVLAATVALIAMIFSVVVGTPLSARADDPNVAVGKIASADSGSGTAEYGIDDSIYTAWRADDGSPGHYFQVDLGTAHTLSGSAVVWEAPYLIKYKIEVSTNGTTWTTAVDKTNNSSSDQVQTDTFSQSGKRYVRITITDLPAGTHASINEFRIFGVTGGGGPSAPSSFTQSSPASSATGVSTTPALSWTAAAGATSYAVVVSTNSSYSSPVVNATGLTGTSYTVPSALANSTTYYWKVTASNSGGSTVASNAGITFTTTGAATTIPGTFTQTAPAASATGISTNPTLTWGAASGASTYAVVVSTNSSFSNPVVNVTGLTGTSYAVPSGLANNTQYYWRVTATNAAGNRIAGNSGISFTTGAAAPGGFTQSSPASGASNVSTTPTLSWTASPGATSYTVVVSTSSSFASPVVNSSGITGTSLAVTPPLAAGTQYYWRVTAVNGVGSTQAGNAGASFTTSAGCVGTCTGLTSGAYVVNNANSTISKVEQGTTVAQFLANVNAPSNSTVQVFKDNGFTPRSGSDLIETSNLAVVSGAVSKTYTISVIKTTLIGTIADTFDNAAGNDTLGGWGLPYGGSVVTVSGSNKALKIVNSGENAFDQSRNFAPVSGTVRVTERMLFTNLSSLKSAPRIFGNADLIGELRLQNGQLLISNGGSWAVVAGGGAIAPNVWYDITVEVDTDTDTYKAWVGTAAPSGSHPLLTPASSVSGIAYVLPQSDTGGIQIDSLRVDKVDQANIAAPLSSIARASIANDYFVVTDSGNSGGAITVYTNTSVNDLLSRVSGVNGGAIAVPGKTGASILTGSDTVVVTSADGSTTRTYSVSVAVNTNAKVYSLYAPVVVDNSAGTVSGIEQDTSVDTLRGLLEPAKNGSFVIKSQSGATKTTGIILATDTLLVTAESSSVSPRTFTLSLLPDTIVARYYVDPVAGNDANSGTIGSPFRTLAQAKSTVNLVKNGINGDIGIYLRGGTYQLSAPFVLNGLDSGVNGHKIVYKAYPGETPSLSGGEVITGWTVDKTVGGNTVYKANAHSLTFGQLYVNDRPATLARFPNAGTENSVTGWDLSTGSPKVATSEVPSFSNPSNNPARIRVQARWIDIALPIQSLTSAGGVTTVTPTSPASQPAANMAPGTQGPGNPYHFDNAYAFLDVPGEWYLDKSTNTVYYVAAPGQSMSSLKVVAPKLEEIVKFQGTLNNPVRNIEFNGVTLEHTTWLAPLTDGYMWGSWSSFPSYTDTTGNKQPGWTTAVAHRPLSAVLIEKAQNISIVKSTVRNTGGVGIFLRESQNNSIIGNAIYDVGYHGIQAGMFQNFDSDVYPGVDYEKGTPTDTRYIQKDDVIANNYISRVGSNFLGGIGIKLGWISNTVIEHNDIYNVPYSGMMLGNGKPTLVSPLGNLQVRFNNVSRANTLLSDGAAIYAYAKHSPRTVIEGNFLHDGFYSQYEDSSNVLGLYFDDGANGFTVKNNLVTNMVSGFINGGVGEHIDRGGIFTGNQPTNPAEIASIIANAGQEVPYRFQRLAPTATHFPGTVRLTSGDTGGLRVRFEFAPGWTVYYTTNGSTPTTSSSVASGYVTIPTGATTQLRVVAINNSTGARSEELAGTYVIETVLYQYSLDGNTATAPMIEGHTRSTFVQQSSGWRWSGFTPKPANPDATPPAAGEEWKDVDTTMYLDPGVGAHIQFTGRPTGSGSTSGAYAYSIVSSTGSSTTANGSLNGLQAARVEVGSDGGAWPYLPATANIAGPPYPAVTRLLMRDGNGTWFLSTASTAPTINKAGNFTFAPLNTLGWQQLNTASQAILNSAPNPDARVGAISVNSALVTPDLSQITGTGLYIDSVANETSYLRFRGMTFLG